MFYIILFVGIFILVIILIIIYTMPRPLLYFIQQIYGVRFYFDESQMNNKKVVYLTIDDSPTLNTTQILSVLDKYNVKASFFVISETFNQTTHPNFNKIVDQISKAGHDVCNHTATETASICLGKFFTDSMNHSSNAIETITGKKPKFLRPGSGLFNSYILDEAKKKNMSVVLGDVYPHDAFISCVFLNALYVKTFVQNGSIIILHDRPWTIDVLDSVIPNLLEKGFIFLKLSDSIQL